MRLIFQIFLLLALISCSEEKIKPTVETGLSDGEIPVQESWDTEIRFTEEGNLKAILNADHLSMFESDQTTLLQGVKIDFYNAEGENNSTLTSKRGKVDDATKNMFAIDSVVAVSDSGVTLLTDELMWRNKDQKIVTDKFVTILTEEEKIEGYGFESDQDLSNYVIYDITYITHSSSEEK